MVSSWEFRNSEHEDSDCSWIQIPNLGSLRWSIQFKLTTLAIIIDYDEKRTPHFTGSTPEHGSSSTSPSKISISFNYPIVKGSNIILYDLEGNKKAEGGLITTRLGLEISSVPKLNSGIYKVTYHAIWLGGSAHDGEFYFDVK